MNASSRWRSNAPLIGGFAVLLALAYRPVFSGRAIAGVDAFQLAIPDATFLLDCLRAHEWPLWTPYQRLGQPFAAQIQTQAFYLPRLLSVLVAGPIRGITLEQMFHAAVSCAGTWLACRALGRSRTASFVASAAFALGPFCTELANVPNIAGAASWSGAILAAAIHADRERTWRASVPLAFAVTASLLCGSPETLLWQLAAVMAVVGWRGLSRLPVPLTLAGLLSGVTLVPALELLRNSIRIESVPGQFNWSAPVASLAALFWLNADLPRPPGEQILVVCLFQGTIICVLALISLRTAGPARRLFLLGVGLAVLALGGRFPPARLLLSVPPLSLFRYPVKYLVGTSFCLSMAAAAGLDALGSLRLTRSGALAGVAVLALMPLLPVRAGARTGLPWTALFLACGAIAWALPRSLHRSDLVTFGIGTLALTELGLVSFLWGAPLWLPVEELARPSALAAVLPKPTEGRVSVQVSNAERWAHWPDAETAARRSRENLLPLRNVEEHVAIVEGYGPPEPRDYVEALRRNERALDDLAGVTRYLRVGDPPFPDLRRIDGVPGDLNVFRSETARPRAFWRTVDVAGRCVSQPPRWTEYRASSLALDVTACASSTLIVTDSWFPGWLATVDGQPAELRRESDLVRAVDVPSGHHTVRMVYQPRSFLFGVLATVLGLLVAAGLVWKGPSISASHGSHASSARDPSCGCVVDVIQRCGSAVGHRSTGSAAGSSRLRLNAPFSGDP